MITWAQEGASMRRVKFRYLDVKGVFGARLRLLKSSEFGDRRKEVHGFHQLVRGILDLTVEPLTGQGVDVPEGLTRSVQR